MSGKQQRPKTDTGGGPDYESNYTSTYGNTVGEFLWGQVDKNANPDKLDKHAHGLIDSGTSHLSELMVENASPEDAQLAADAAAYMRGDFGEQLKLGYSDTDVSESIYALMGENPVGTGFLAAAGAAAYIASDPDLKFDHDFDLSDKTALTIGGDAGSLFDIGLEEVNAGITHTDGRQKYGANGSYNFDTDLARLNAFYSTNNGAGTSFNANAYVTDQGDRNTAGANLRYLTPDWGAKAGLTYDNMHPKFGEYGTANASIYSRGDDPTSWNLSGSMDTEGAYRLEGGYHYNRDNTSFGLEGFAGRNNEGESDAGIQAVFKHRF